MVPALPALIEPPPPSVFADDLRRPARPDGGGFVATLREAAEEARPAPDRAATPTTKAPDERDGAPIDRDADRPPAADDAGPEADAPQGEDRADEPRPDAATDDTAPDDGADTPLDGTETVEPNDVATEETAENATVAAPVDWAGDARTSNTTAVLTPVLPEVGANGAVTSNGATDAATEGSSAPTRSPETTVPATPVPSTGAGGVTTTAAPTIPDAVTDAPAAARLSEVVRGAAAPIAPIAPGARSTAAPTVAIDATAPSGAAPVPSAETSTEQGRTGYRENSAARGRLEAVADPAASGGNAAAGRALQVDQAVRLEQQAVELGGPGAGRAAPATTSEAPRAAAPIEAPSPRGGVVREPEGPPLRTQVVRGFTAMINQRGGAMTMRLQPPELGQLRVQMQIHQGRVSAQIQASSVQAHAMLERDIGSLRAALESSGLDVERLTVQVQSGGNGTSLGQHGGEGQDGARPDHDAAGNESRGRGSHRPDSGGRDLEEVAFDELIDALGRDHAPAATEGATIE